MERSVRLASKPRAALAFAVVAALALAAAGAPRRAAAAGERTSPGALERWAGAYAYAGGADERAALERAIAEATADMNALTRRIARSRLERDMRPEPRIVVRVSGSTVGIGEKGNWRTTLDGPAQVFQEDGDRYRVRHAHEGPRIVQVIEGDSVRIRKAYSLSDDGSELRVSVRFAHERLPAPLRYELTYRRAR